MGVTVAEMEEEFCSNSLFETVDIMRQLSDYLIPQIYRDLFLEQRKN